MITTSPTPFLNCQILNKSQPLCNDSAQGRFIFVVLEINNMAKENIEKSYNFGASEFNREAKRLAQKQLKQGLPVTVDIPNDADAEDLAMLNAFDKWLRDGQPVE